MNSPLLSRSFIPGRYDLFAGLDVDKRSMAVSFLDQQGNLRSLRMPYGAKPLLNYVHKHFPTQKVIFAYEAGPTGWGVYDELTAKGHPCIVVSPAMVPRAPGQRVKTNRLDSRKLAQGLRGGELKGIQVPSIPYRQLRHLVQLRDTLVRQITATKLRIKALLLFEGIAFPEAPAGSQWSRRVRAELKALPCSAAVRFKLDRLLAQLEFSEQQVRQTLKEIHRLCGYDPELHRCLGYLKSIPGIGSIVATHLLARIGDWRQLDNVRQIGAFLGVVPREESTGEDIRRGPIIRSGDSRLRSKLIQSAWAAIRQDAELREFYRRIYQRHHRDQAARKAIVAVARKLTTRIYCVLKEQRPYVLKAQKTSPPLTPEEVEGLPGETRRQAEA